MSNVFARAAEILREHGWVQGQLHDRSKYTDDDLGGAYPVDCPHCAMGALIAASQNDWPSAEMTTLVGEVRATTQYGGIGAWNDASGRTVDEVLAVLDRLAAGAA